MITVGIDNGISGGIAMFDVETNELQVMPMPVVKVAKAKGFKNEYNISVIIQMLKNQRINLAVLEKAQAFPGQGSVSMFSVGRCFGIMEGILAGLGIPYMVVHPKSWQKRMFEGVPHGTGQSKQASILVAQRLFPNTRFVTGEKSIKLHDGMSDAALMAVYASKL